MTQNETVVAARKQALNTAIELYADAITRWGMGHSMTTLAAELVAFETRRYNTAVFALSTTKE